MSLIGDSDRDVVDESDSSKRPLWGSVVVGEEGIFPSKLGVIWCHVWMNVDGWGRRFLCCWCGR